MRETIKLINMLPAGKTSELYKGVRKSYKDVDAFEKRMKEDPDYALVHQDDLRLLKLRKK